VLLSVIRECCQDLEKVTSGDRLISVDLELVCNEILAGQVPESWMKASYLTDKPVAAYIVDLETRTSVITSWITTGFTKIIDLGMFFFP
jgi:hypothetical protein